MNSFNRYAEYYDLLYEDKDYSGEASYVHELLQNVKPESLSILEFGCGTGGHAIWLAKQGYRVVGVDISEEMCKRAEQRVTEIESCKGGALTFRTDDIRSMRLEEKFDAVVALFHVVSYQWRNEDVESAFRTARAHLKEGGVFLFDCWYGPAVLVNTPESRTKQVETRNVSVVREAKPSLLINENIVDVHYQLSIMEKISGESHRVEELHRMRYFFKPEIEMFLSHSGFKYLNCWRWLTQAEPDTQSWSVVFVAVA